MIDIRVPVAQKREQRQRDDYATVDFHADRSLVGDPHFYFDFFLGLPFEPQGDDITEEVRAARSKIAYSDQVVTEDGRRHADLPGVPAADRMLLACMPAR